MPLKPELMIWCDRVRRVRKRGGLTQQNLADILRVNRETVALWEARIERPYSRATERFLELESRLPEPDDGKAEK